MGTVEGREELMGKGLIWPAEDEDSRLTREVYARFGLASYHAQVLEAGMVQALVVLRMLPQMKEFSDRSEWEAAFDGFTASQEKLTFGRLVDHLEKSAAVPNELRALVQEARTSRNFLIHHFFRERAEEFFSQRGRLAMLRELEGYAETLMRADDLLSRWIEPFGKTYGLSSEKIDQDVRKIVERNRGR